MNKNKCIICGSDISGSKYNGLLQCQNCRFITTDIGLSNEQLKSLYSKDYFHGNEYGNYIADKKIIQKNFISRINILSRYISDMESKSLFEIGCAYGFFLEIAKEVFNSVSGIDISDDATDYAKKNLGLDVYADNFLSFEMTRNYDVFCMWDTVEHLKEPDLFIKKISSHINKDGLLAITTGDIESINARIRGRKWRQIHPPTHLHYFSKNSLSMLLEENGFEVVYTGHPGNYLSFNNIAHILLVLKSNKPELYRKLKAWGILEFSIYINLFDFLFIIGKKL